MALKKSSSKDASGGMELSGVPRIASTPLAGTQSREYAKLQERQNVELAKKALQEKTAAISTPTRQGYLGEFGGQLSTGQGARAGCSVSELIKARAAGVSASELACRGCGADVLRAAGYSAAELRNAGFTAAQLRNAGFSIDDLKKAGFSLHKKTAFRQLFSLQRIGAFKSL